MVLKKMESDSTVITTSPIQSNSDSMPPTPNSVENSSNSSPTNNHFNNKQNKREITVLTNNQSIMTTQSNRRRHYSASSSSSLDDAIDVVNETNKKQNNNKHINKKLNSNTDTNNELINQKLKLIKSESPSIQKSTSLNNSLNGNLEHKSIKLNGNTILHSPNSNSSTNSQFDNSTTTKLNSAASLIANLEADQANRKFKTFLIDDILSQEQKQKQQQLLLLHQQQLLLQQFNNSNKLLPPLSPNTTNQSSPNSVNNLVNNNENNLNDMNSMSAAAAVAAYNSLTNSIIRPWDLANVAAAATLSQLTNSQNLNGQQNPASVAANLSAAAAGLTPSTHSLALNLGSNVQTNASSTQQLNNHLNQANHFTNQGSSLLQLNNPNQLAMALAASQSNNKLNLQQLQQLSRFGYPHLMPGNNFASSLSHLSAHHQFLAGLNSGTANLFPNLTNNLNANALNALKNDPASFRLHSLANTFAGQNLSAQTTAANDANMMQHLINSNNNSAATSASSNLTNGQSKTNKNVNIKQEQKSINENGKRLNVEDLDDEDDYENDTIMTDDCDDKCSMNSSTNGKSTKPTNGDDSSPLSALYELANKNFEMTRNEKSVSSENGTERMNSMFSNNGQNAKKKRKSRTAFTNKQIYELEKKFIYQKYLTPADRDDLAEKLELSGAQVITWFQNRRAKMKRDNEEINKDYQTVTKFFPMPGQLFYNKALIENTIPMYENLQNIELFKAKMHNLMPLTSKTPKKEDDDFKMRI